MLVVDPVDVHTAYMFNPPAGMLTTCPSEYDVPVPNDDVSHRDSVNPDLAKFPPLLKVILVPVAAY